MPSVPAPIGRSTAGGPWWTAILGQITAQQGQINQLQQGAQQTNTVDQYGNTTLISGQLNQVVTIGASHGVAGVQVGTGLPVTATGSTAGLASQHALVVGAITVVAGSTAATIVSGLAGIAVNQQIGAADVSDPKTGIATPAIFPGTYVKTLPGGSALTLSQPAAESGTALLAAACTWVLL